MAHTPAGCPAVLLSEGAGPTKGWPYDSDGIHNQAEASCWVNSANATTVSAFFVFKEVQYVRFIKSCSYQVFSNNLIWKLSQIFLKQLLVLTVGFLWMFRLLLLMNQISLPKQNIP